MLDPKISVIVPIYNVEGYIRRCMEGLMCQSMREIEVICVDDRGADDSLRIVEDYKRKDERIRIIHHDRNRGLSAARNTGLAHARAPYIMFCDSDDYYAPTMCEEMFAAISLSEDADLAMCGTAAFYDSDCCRSSVEGRYLQLPHSGLQPVSDELLSRCNVFAWNKIYRRKLLDQYDIRFPEGLLYEDAYFFNVYALYTRSIVFVPNELYNYCRREGSIMHDTMFGSAEKNLDHLRVAERLYKYMEERGMTDQKHLNSFGRVFFTLFESALKYAGTDQKRAAVFDAAQAFLTHSASILLSCDTWRYAAQLIMKRTYIGDEKQHLAGLVRIKQKRKYKKLYVFGVPIYHFK